MTTRQHIIILAALLAAAGCSDPARDKTVTNLALRRMATASSSYDYNLTAQLLTDGIGCYSQPVWLRVTTSAGELPRREKEWTLDAGPYSSNTLRGDSDFIEYEWSGQKFSAGCVRIVGTLVCREEAGNWKVSCFAGSDDLHPVGDLDGSGLPGSPRRPVKVSDPNKQAGEISLPARSLRLEIPLDGAVDFSRFRIEFSIDGGVYWEINSVDFTPEDSFPPKTGSGPYESKESRGFNTLPSAVFTSAWMSADDSPQWVSVDLGRKCTLRGVNIHWIHKAESAWIETSVDGRSWRKAVKVPDGEGLLSVVKFPRRQGRFVRLRMETPHQSGHFCIGEIEVLGKSPKQEGGPRERSAWTLQRASEVGAGGEEISTPAFDDSLWMDAVVPGTVLYSYIAAGAVPDPAIADNNQQISESYFNSDFWYRWETSLDTLAFSDQRVSLCFDGINWKAEVFMNGVRLGDIAGAFRGKTFDVTGIAAAENVVAVHVFPPSHFGAVKEKNAESPDFNGGQLGADNPTFHASVGWDWIPTVRGRETGIWNDVHLDFTGDVLLSSPLVQTRLSPGDTLSSITVRVNLENLSDSPSLGVLEGTIDSIRFSTVIALAPHEKMSAEFTPESFPQLKDQRLALWWPNGYGSQVLHPVTLRFIPQGGVPEADPRPSRHDLFFMAGLREVICRDAMTDLKLYVNGHRFFPKGGNWGFSEFNLRFGAEDYDTSVRLHKEMNLNMIRNWVGQTGDDEFYEACDRYGILVWQDFWLANPADGPDPDDEDMFVDNATDFVGRIRRHPCIALYCGRNEGYPPLSLDARLKGVVASLHGDMSYIPSSADDGVSGHGPYRAVEPDSYFSIPSEKFHTERGMPAFMSYSSLQRTMTGKHLWPWNDVWGQHDFTRTGAQGDTAFVGMVRRRFGQEALSSAQEFARYAQSINYDGYRAMYEANNASGKGLLIWMSHSCWPSLAWQTYDYWFDRTGAFFGVMKACEPLHIQINPSSRMVEVVNYTPSKAEGLLASIRLTGIDGREVYRKEALVSLGEGGVVSIIDISDVPDGPVIADLLLESCGGETLSSNRYMRNFKGGDDTGDYRLIARRGDFEYPPVTSPQDSSGSRH